MKRICKDNTILLSFIIGLLIVEIIGVVLNMLIPFYGGAIAFIIGLIVSVVNEIKYDIDGVDNKDFYDLKLFYATAIGAAIGFILITI